MSWNAAARHYTMGITARSTWLLLVCVCVFIAALASSDLLSFSVTMCTAALQRPRYSETMTAWRMCTT